MSAETPYFAAICARQRLVHIRNRFCEDIKDSGLMSDSIDVRLAFLFYYL